MAEPTIAQVGVQQLVPLLMVKNMATSLRFYVEGLGFSMAKKWTPGQNPLVLARARHGRTHASGVRVGGPPRVTHSRAGWGGSGTEFYLLCRIGLLPCHER